MPEKLPFYPDAILLDVDGTLFDTKHDFSPLTRAVLRAYLSRPELPKLALCTGRHVATLINTVLPFFAELAPDSLHVVSGGAMLINAKREILWQRVMPGSMVQEICQTVESLGGSFGFGNGEVFYSGRAMLQDRLNELVLPTIDFRSSDEIQNQQQWETPLIVVSYINKAVRRYVESLEQNLTIKEMLSQRNGLPYFDLTLPGINKTVAASELAKRYQILPGKIVHIGDSPNDSEMMNWAGLGVAVANASADILAIADWVLPLTNDEDAVAKFLQLVMEAYPAGSN